MGYLISFLSGVCVISSVLSHHSKDFIWWTSVIALLQLSFIWQKKWIVHPQGIRTSQPQRRGLNLNPLPSYFYTFVSSPTLSLPCAKWAGQEGGVFVSPKVLSLVHGFSFVPFSWAFLFVF